jgi:hypothetical protein
MCSSFDNAPIVNDKDLIGSHNIFAGKHLFKVFAIFVDDICRKAHLIDNYVFLCQNRYIFLTRRNRDFGKKTRTLRRP